jgi:tetratricopeptide (TPR) repeat protein
VAWNPTSRASIRVEHGAVRPAPARRLPVRATFRYTKTTAQRFRVIGPAMAKPQRDFRSELFTAIAHHRAGRLDEAEAIYRDVLKQAPKEPDALNLLGVLLQDRGRPARAVQLISQALRARRNFPEALTNLARAQRAAGDADGAVDSARRAIALAPDLVEAHVQLGRALLDLEDNAGAAEACRRAVALAPTTLDAWVNLGAALLALRDDSGAAQAYQIAHTLQPDRAQTLTDFAVALGRMERYDEALQCHERAIALDPADPRAHALHATTLTFAQDIAGSVVACRRALALVPTGADVWLLLGNNLAALGQFDETITCYRRVLALDPDSAEAKRAMVAVGAHIDDAAEHAWLDEILANDALPPPQRISAAFALGELLDKAGDYDAAFERMVVANRLARQERAAEGRAFDRDATRRQVDGLVTHFTPATFQRTRGWGIQSELPVFIVGMPRSGTTLTEQIVASHPRVFGTGERKDIGRIARILGADGPARDPLVWDREVVSREADAHLARLQARGGRAARVTDKMPDNILWLGLIAVLFPGARVVFCRRDLRDVGLSCYFQNFTDGMAWSNDLEDCAVRAREIERLTRHWRAALPLRMLEVQYENLVSDLEGESRRLIDFLGLPWDPTCLAFHETDRPIMTASVWQVRQPLYASSVGRWRHYRRHLGPLLPGLEGLLPPDEAASPASALAAASAPAT